MLISIKRKFFPLIKHRLKNFKPKQMILLKTKNYKKNCVFLPKKDRILLNVQEQLLEKDIFHSKLHTKRLKGFPDDHVYSFRITRVYRGIFRLSGDKVILFAIGHRKDIYQSF